MQFSASRRLHIPSLLKMEKIQERSMKEKSQMGSKWTYYMSLICLLSFYTKLTIASDILQPMKLAVNSNVNVNTLGGSISSLVAYELDSIHQKQEFAEESSQSLETAQNSTSQLSYLDPDAPQKSTTAGTVPQRPNISDPGIIIHEPNTTRDFTVMSESGTEFLDNVDTSNFTSLPNLTSSENLTNVDMANSTHYTIWKHFINFTHFVVHHKYIGDDEELEDSRMKKFFGAHKLLALFLGMAGVLACLFIIVYCIYIRQHKEDMFSHHRLYGEGFEDPVLHLDTPVDHLDFFSFRDTELTPAPTPQHKCQTPETYDTKGDYRAEAPKGNSSNEHLHQNIQMGSMKFS